MSESRSPKAGLGTLQNPARAWWRSKTRRERQAVLLLAALVIAGLGWALVWRPLVLDTERLEREAARDERALLQARRDAQDIGRLARTPLPAVVDPVMALDRSLDRAALRDAVTELTWQGRRARVTLANAAFPAVIAWLEALQRESGLHPVEATFSSLVEPGRVRAEIVLAP